MCSAGSEATLRRTALLIAFALGAWPASAQQPALAQQQSGAQAPATAVVDAAALAARLRHDGLVDLSATPWRARLGDDPAWAGPDFDDRDWALLRPRSALPDSIRVAAQDEERAGRSGIVWFRLHLHVAGDAAGRALLLIENTGPQEVYLDGRLIAASGDPTAPARGAGANTLAGPMEVDLPAGARVIAVRFNAAAHFDIFTGIEPFRMGVLSHAGEQVWLRWIRAEHLWSGIVGGLLLTLGGLHLLLFGVLRNQRAHLYYAGFALLLGSALVAIVLRFSIDGLRTQLTVHGLALSAAAMSFYLLLAFLYSTFRRPVPRLYWVLVTISLITSVIGRIPQAAWGPAWLVWLMDTAAVVAPFIALLDGFRLIIVAVRQRVDGARIIAAGLVITLAVFALAIAPTLTGGIIADLPVWLWRLGFVALPIASSVYLVRSIGRTSRGFERLSVHLEEEVTQRTEELREARIIADEANRAKSQFLANMSHELRTPLNAIIGYSEMLMDESRDAGRDEMIPDLERVHGAGRHLLGLINDVLDLSKVEAGRMDVLIEEFDVDRVVAEVSSTIQPLLAKNHNTLKAGVDTGLGRIRADEVKVRQILYNLLSNASKFTSNGTVRLRASRDGDHIVFTVADTGIGMTAEQMAKLFQPFTQAEAGTSRKYGGTGLGLAISRRFAELMGGTIDVASEAGAGTTFTVRLPAVVEEPVPAGS